MGLYHQAINQQLEMASRIRQNYKEDCEALINKQVNMELMASYTYMSMACYFDRDDVAYYGFSSYFKKNSDEEREHSEKFLKYQNKRGGKVVFQDIARPTTTEGLSPGGHGGCPGAREDGQPESSRPSQGS